MKIFEVTMTEIGRDGKARKITLTAFCENRRQVIDFYGLKEPDIVDYEIKEVQ